MECIESILFISIMNEFIWWCMNSIKLYFMMSLNHGIFIFLCLSTHQSPNWIDMLYKYTRAYILSIHIYIINQLCLIP